MVKNNSNDAGNDLGAEEPPLLFICVTQMLKLIKVFNSLHEIHYGYI
jgi:hypothetical protein